MTSSEAETYALIEKHGLEAVLDAVRTWLLAAEKEPDRLQKGLSRHTQDQQGP